MLDILRNILDTVPKVPNIVMNLCECLFLIGFDIVIGTLLHGGTLEVRASTRHCRDVDVDVVDVNCAVFHPELLGYTYY